MFFASISKWFVDKISEFIPTNTLKQKQNISSRFHQLIRICFKPRVGGSLHWYLYLFPKLWLDYILVLSNNQTELIVVAYTCTTRTCMRLFVTLYLGQFTKQKMALKYTHCLFYTSRSVLFLPSWCPKMSIYTSRYLTVL